MGSSDQAHPGGQPRRPVRAAGLRSPHVARRLGSSRRSVFSRLRPRPLVAAALVAVVGVGLVWRSRAATPGAGPVSTPTLAVVGSAPTDVTVDVRSQTPPTSETPPGLVTAAPPTPTNVDVSAPPPGAAIQAIAPTATAPPAAVEAPSVTSTPSWPTTAPTSAPTEAASTEPQAVQPADDGEPEPGPTTPAPAPAPAPRPVGPSYRTYVVQRGDILKQIAARYGVSMASILALNTIPNPDSLTIGQVLTIPPAGS